MAKTLALQPASVTWLQLEGTLVASSAAVAAELAVAAADVAATKVSAESSLL